MGRKVLVAALLVFVPLTACLVFAAGVALHSHSASHATLRLPSGVTTSTTALVPLVVAGRLVAAAAPVAISLAPQPPFVPPRA